MENSHNKLIMRKILILILLIIPFALNATTYYVKNGGSNGNTGLSDAQAWQTIAKINSTSFSPGDIISFNRGDMWREELIVPSSGTNGAYIIFNSYGTGANPKILGSLQLTTWTNTSGNLWRSSTSVVDPYVQNEASEIFFENNDGTKAWGSKQTTPTALYQWSWSANNITVYSTSDPSTAFKSIEVPQRESCVMLNKKNYLDFNGIDMLYSRWSGYGYDWTHNDMYEQYGLTIENSDIGYIGETINDGNTSNESGYGIEVVYDNMTIRNNTIHDCGRRSIAMDIYGSGYTAKNILVELNEFYDGFHTTGCDIDVGAGYTGSIDNITIRRNYFHEYSQSRNSEYSNYIFVQNNAVGSCTLTNLYIYDNIFKWQNAYSILMENAQSVYIYNNIFYDRNAINNWAPFVAVQGSSVATVKNNIFYMTVSAGVMLEKDTPGNVTSDYNYYHNCTISGTESHSLTGDPKIVSSSDFHLQLGSPAIGKGVSVAAVTVDYAGNSWSSPPSMGVYEYGSSPATATYLIVINGSVLVSGGKVVTITK